MKIIELINRSYKAIILIQINKIKTPMSQDKT